MPEKIILYTDGGARGNPGPAGAGAVIIDRRGGVIKKASKALGVLTNNEAEYQAVIFGLATIKKHFGKEKVKTLAIEHRLDSELVCQQLNGKYQIKEQHLWPLFMKVWNAKVADFKNLTHHYIPREENRAADRLANEAMAGAAAGSNELF